MVHDMYLVEVKTPSESSGPWDYYKIIATIPGDQAFRPAGEDGCPHLDTKRPITAIVIFAQKGFYESKNPFLSRDFDVR
jgi:hypothetical protein